MTGLGRRPKNRREVTVAALWFLFGYIVGIVAASAVLVTASLVLKGAIQPIWFN